MQKSLRKNNFLFFRTNSIFFSQICEKQPLGKGGEEGWGLKFFARKGERGDTPENVHCFIKLILNTQKTTRTNFFEYQH